MPHENLSSSGTKCTTYRTEISSDSGNEAIEDIIPNDNSVTSILYEPPLDTWSRQMKMLWFLRGFSESSPGNTYLFYELFPKINDHLIFLAMGNDGLRHSLLALSAIVRDLYLHQEPSELFFTERAKSLRLLQEAITNDNIDDSLFASVIMQQAMDIFAGNVNVVKRHIRGLYLIFERLRKQAANASGNKQSLSPMALLIRRMAARSDSESACLFEEFPQWPVLTPLDEMEDRNWLTKLTGLSHNMSPNNIEWALASFEMDNLWNRTYTFAKQSDIYRTSQDPQAEEKIQAEYQKLTQSFELWRQRSIVAQQETIELYCEQITPPSTDPALRFLWHEPLYLDSVYFAKLLNQWRAARIYASIVVDPVPGPTTPFANRFQIAVDLCRTQAALGKDGFIGPQWQCLFYAGLAFGAENFYPLESNWVLGRLRVIGIAFPILSPMVEKMPAIWRSDKVHWNAFGRLYPGVGEAS